MSTGSFLTKVGGGSRAMTGEGLAHHPGVGKQTLVEAAYVQRKAVDPAQALPDLGAARANALPTSGGAPLQTSVRQRMEAVFGRQLSAVRVHQGPEAAALGARAVTRGNDIYFAPRQYAPETPAGLELLGHELSHVVQQGDGRVAAPQAKGGGVTADAALEREADEHGALAARGARIAGPAGGDTSGAGGAQAAVQPKWLPSPYHKEFYEWDKLLNGLRWYVHRETHAMYFIVVQATEANRAMVQHQQRIKTYQEWLELGFAVLEGADNSVDEEGGRQIRTTVDPLTKEHDSTPFTYTTVSHTMNRQGTFMREDTEFHQPKVKGDFPKPLDVAIAHGMPTGIKDKHNVGGWVFHLTSYRNLMNAPDDSRKGIMFTGLQPSLGGGKGGACETSQVTANESMVSESQEHSKNRIAVNTGPSNVMLYANQRLAFNNKQFGEGLYSETDLVERDGVLLRFRLTEEQIESMVIDPKHPKDRHVRLIQNVAVPPKAIEALTSEGWIPVVKLDPETLKSMMPQLPDLKEK